MILSFHPCIEADIQIILGDRTPDSHEIELIKKADAIILPQACPKELFYICSESGAALFPEYRFRFKYPEKSGQIKLFQELGLPYPCSRCWNNFEDLLKNWDKLSYKLPFILKEDKKHEGAGVYVIKSKDDLYRIANRLNKSDILITQELIESGGNVLRVVIIGKRIISYWKRASKPDQFIVSVSSNAIIDHFWMPSLQEKGKALIRDLVSITGINLAAVDMVFKKNIPLLLEINYYFGRRGIGSTEKYYHMLYEAIKDWLKDKGLPSDSIKLVY